MLCRCRRVLTGLAVMICCTTVLTACFSIPVKYAPSPSPGTAATAAPASAVPQEVVAFAEGTTTVLHACVDWSESLNGAPLDFLLRPWAEQQEGPGAYTYMKLALTPSGAKTPSLTVTGESILNSSSGDASFVATRQKAGGAEVKAGMWFTGSTMLVQKADSSQPLLNQTLNSQVAASLQSLPAFYRFSHLMGDIGAKRLSDDAWKAENDVLEAAVCENTRVPDLSAGAGVESLSGVMVDATTTTVKLLGQRGLGVVKAALQYLAKDPDFKALLNTQKLDGANNYELTGLDGMLRDLDGLKDTDRPHAVTTLKLISAPGPVGLTINSEVAGKTFQCTLAFYNGVAGKGSGMTFRLFDGSTMTVKQKVTQNGSGAFQAVVWGDVQGPGGTPEENISVIAQGQRTGVDISVTSDLSYTKAASALSPPVLLRGQLIYGQKTENGTVQGSGSGSLQLTQNDSVSAWSAQLSAAATDKTVPIAPPVYTAQNGRSSYSQDGLYKGLGDFNGSAFALAPFTTRVQALLGLLFN